MLLRIVIIEYKFWSKILSVLNFVFRVCQILTEDFPYSIKQEPCHGVCKTAYLSLTLLAYLSRALLANLLSLLFLSISSLSSLPTSSMPTIDWLSLSFPLSWLSDFTDEDFIDLFGSSDLLLSIKNNITILTTEVEVKTNAELVVWRTSVTVTLGMLNYSKQYHCDHHHPIIID